MQQSDSGLAVIGFRSRLAEVGHFVRHFIEMMLAMVVGMAALMWPTLTVLGLLGVPEAVIRAPVAYVLIMTLAMTAPMAAWMRFRGMELAPILEMSGAMVVETALVIGAFWIGVIPGDSLLRVDMNLMIPAMLGAMLYRRDVYTGHAGHRAHAA